MNGVESTLSFIENLCYLSGSLARENGTYDRTDMLPVVLKSTLKTEKENNKP